MVCYHGSIILLLSTLLLIFFPLRSYSQITVFPPTLYQYLEHETDIFISNGDTCAVIVWEYYKLNFTSLFYDTELYSKTEFDTAVLGEYFISRSLLIGKGFSVDRPPQVNPLPNFWMQNAMDMNFLKNTNTSILKISPLLQCEESIRKDLCFRISPTRFYTDSNLDEFYLVTKLDAVVMKNGTHSSTGDFVEGIHEIHNRFSVKGFQSGDERDTMNFWKNEQSRNYFTWNIRIQQSQLKMNESQFQIRIHLLDPRFLNSENVSLINLNSNSWDTMRVSQQLLTKNQISLELQQKYPLTTALLMLNFTYNENLNTFVESKPIGSLTYMDFSFRIKYPMVATGCLEQYSVWKLIPPPYMTWVGSFLLTTIALAVGFIFFICIQCKETCKFWTGLSVNWDSQKKKKKVRRVKGKNRKNVKHLKGRRLDPTKVYSIAALKPIFEDEEEEEDYPEEGDQIQQYDDADQWENEEENESIQTLQQDHTTTMYKSMKD